jgi:hypothetical protein
LSGCDRTSPLRSAISAQLRSLRKPTNTPNVPW